MMQADRYPRKSDPIQSPLLPSRAGHQLGPTVSDGILVQRARCGDLLAQDSLFRRHRNRVYRLSYRLVGWSDADDLLQDCFVAAFAQLNRLRQPHAFSVWLSAIVVRTAHKRLRRRQVLERLGLRPRMPIDVDLFVSPWALPDVGAEFRRICAVVERMPKETQIALLLRRVEGFSFDEIAEKMNRSPATIKRRLAHAERIMNRKLADASETEETG